MPTEQHLTSDASDSRMTEPVKPSKHTLGGAHTISKTLPPERASRQRISSTPLRDSRERRPWTRRRTGMGEKKKGSTRHAERSISACVTESRGAGRPPGTKLTLSDDCRDGSSQTNLSRSRGRLAGCTPGQRALGRRRRKATPLEGCRKGAGPPSTTTTTHRSHFGQGSDIAEAISGAWVLLREPLCSSGALHCVSTAFLVLTPMLSGASRPFVSWAVPGIWFAMLSHVVCGSQQQLCCKFDACAATLDATGLGHSLGFDSCVLFLRMCCVVHVDAVIFMVRCCFVVRWCVLRTCAPERSAAAVGPLRALLRAVLVRGRPWMVRVSRDDAVVGPSCFLL